MADSMTDEQAARQYADEVLANAPATHLYFERNLYLAFLAGARRKREVTDALVQKVARLMADRYGELPNLNDCEHARQILAVALASEEQGE